MNKTLSGCGVTAYEDLIPKVVMIACESGRLRELLITKFLSHSSNLSIPRRRS